MTIDPKNLSATATLTFSDEFNTLSLWNGSSGTWSTKYPFSPENGGTLDGNGEQEWYINAMYAPTDAINPWSVSGGVLTLTAQPAPDWIQPLINGYDYTSGMITTYNSFTQKYGYFEMRADLPAGQGLWPAFWLLQADGSWPPEIDVMEVLGHDMTTLHGGVHTNETGGHTARGAATKVPDMSAGYHTYGVDWQADYVTLYFDGIQRYKTTTPADMHEPMYMIANLAVGGHWPGMVNWTTPFPAQMNIDYIRAYADKSAAAIVGNSAPVATVGDHSLAANQWSQVQGWISYSDANGNAATQYQFWDQGIGANSAYFWTSSNSHHPSETVITVNAADMANVWVRGGQVAGSESLWVRAFDGTHWSQWDAFTFTTVANRLPVATVGDRSLAANQWSQVQGWISYSDADGNAATQYQFWDQGIAGNSAYFWTSSNAHHPSETVITVNAADLANVWVRGGDITSSENLWVRAFDGTAWSAWDPWNMSTFA